MTLSKFVDGYARLSEVMCKPPRSKARFVTRRAVIAKLLELIDSGMIPVVYGPRGSGKTTLLRCLVQTLSRLGVRSLYVGIHSSPPVLLGTVDHRVMQVARRITAGNGLERGSIVVELARVLGSGSLLVVDDFNIGLRDADISLFLRAVYEGLSAYGETSHLILATGDALVAEKLPLYLTGNLVQTLMWHLSRRETAEFLRTLNAPIDTETVYAYTGGSPGAIVALLEHSWRIDEWVEARIMPMVESAIEELEESGVQLTEVDPDAVASRRILRYTLLKYNLLSPLTGLRLTAVEGGDWIGRRWAWQLPVYMQLFRERV